MGEYQEHQEYRVHTEAAVLDIGGEIGALIIYTSAARHGEEVEVSLQGDDDRRTHTAVLERRVNGRSVFAALFLALAEGEYRIWGEEPNKPRRVRIVGGEVAQVDWR